MTPAGIERHLHTNWKKIEPYVPVGGYASTKYPPELLFRALLIMIHRNLKIGRRLDDSLGSSGKKYPHVAGFYYRFDQWWEASQSGSGTGLIEMWHAYLKTLNRQQLQDLYQAFRRIRSGQAPTGVFNASPGGLTSARWIAFLEDALLRYYLTKYSKSLEIGRLLPDVREVPPLASQPSGASRKNKLVHPTLM